MGYKQHEDAAAKKIANLDEDSAPTNQPGIPVKVFAGHAKLTVDWWMNPAYNQSQEAITTKAQKGARAQVTGYRYFADLGGVICMGPIDSITRIRVEDEVVLDAGGAPLTFGAGLPVPLNIPGYCPHATLYWGTETQAADTSIFLPRGPRPVDVDPRDVTTWDYDPASAAGSALPGHYDAHPRYLGIAWIAFKRLAFGENRTNAPAISVEVSRTPAFLAPTSLTEAGANAAAVTYEWLTNELWGLGLSPALFETSKWVAAHAAFDAARINPVISEQEDFRALAAKVIDYVGGWARVVDETVELGAWPRGPVDPAGLVHITNDDLTEEAELEPDGYTGTINQVRVKFTNRDRAFRDDVQPATNLANRTITGEDRREDIERPWIILPAEAIRGGNDYLARKSQPASQGRLSLHTAKADGVLPGDIVIYEGATAGASQALRAISVERPTAGEARTIIEVEQADWAVGYNAPPRPRDPDFTVRPFSIVHRRAVELPSGLKESAGVELAILAQRPDPSVTGFRVYVAPPPGISYDLADGGESAFAAYGILQAAYGAGTAAIDTTAGMLVRFLGPDAASVTSQSDLQRDNFELLAFVGGEILAVGACAMEAGGLRVFGRRALYGTAKADHSAGDEAWVIARARLPHLTHRYFTPGATVYLKLQAFAAGGENPLEDVTPFSVLVGAASGVPAVAGFGLDTYARRATGNAIEVHVRAAWFAVPDQQIVGYEVSLKRAGDADYLATNRTTTETGTDWVVAPLTTYQVRVRAVNIYGAQGPWTGWAAITSATDENFGVAGLQLKSGGSTWAGPDAEFLWHLQILAGEVGSGDQHPLLRDYRVNIWQRPPSAPNIALPLALVRTVYVADPRFNYSLERNVEDGGPSREVQIGVSARSTEGNHSAEVTLLVSNPFPPRLTGLSAYEFEGDVLKLQLTRPGDPDFKEWRVWRREVPTLLPPGTLESQFSGAAPFFVSAVDRFDLPHQAGAAWQYIIAPVDSFPTPQQPGLMYAVNLTNTSALLQGPVPPPSVDPLSRTFVEGDFVRVYATAPAGLAIRYTRDGSPVTIHDDYWAGNNPPPEGHGDYPDTVFLRFACFDAAGRPSAEVLRNYIRIAAPMSLQVATPTISKSGRPGLSGTATIQCATQGAAIYWRVGNGGWTAYTAPFALGANSTLYAYAAKAGMTDSAAETYDNTGWSGPGVEP